MGKIDIDLVVVFSILYALNMYFQSYGAVSIVKVNAHWFHVRERGIFGGIFGTLISLGIYFAFDWGQNIVEATKYSIAGNLNAFEKFIRFVFGTNPLNFAALNSRLYSVSITQIYRYVIRIRNTSLSGTLSL